VHIDVRLNMPIVHTLAYKGYIFTYTGSVKAGITLLSIGKPRISFKFFKTILHNFRGETIPGGFSVRNPTPEGLGYWVKHNSQKYNTVTLNPRQASFIAALLIHEGYISSSFRDNSIMLRFPVVPRPGYILSPTR
jgi:hypothetical protein